MLKHQLVAKLEIYKTNKKWYYWDDNVIKLLYIFINQNHIANNILIFYTDFLLFLQNQDQAYLLNENYFKKNSTSAQILLRWQSLSNAVYNKSALPLPFHHHEMWTMIFNFFPSQRDVINTQLTCKPFYKLIKDQTFENAEWPLLDYSRAPSISGEFECGPEVNVMAVLLNGNIITGCADGSLRVWNIQTLECVLNTKIKKEGIIALAVLNDGNVIVGFLDGSLSVLDSQTWECIKHINNRFYTYDDMGIAVFPNGDVAVSHYPMSDIDCEFVLDVFDSQNWRCKHSFDDEIYEFKNAAVLKSGDVLIRKELSLNRRICIVDSQTWTFKKSIQDLRGFKGFSILQNGDIAAIAESEIKILDAYTLEIKQTYSNQGKTFKDIATLPNGYLICLDSSNIFFLHFPELNFQLKAEEENSIGLTTSNCILS